MQRRRASKGEFTSPGFRCLALLVLPAVIGFMLSMIWIPETGWLFGIGVVLGLVLAVSYAAYRFTGHGRYNSRRGDRPYLY